jgi:hypothetical protein
MDIEPCRTCMDMRGCEDQPQTAQDTPICVEYKMSPSGEVDGMLQVIEDIVETIGRHIPCTCPDWAPSCVCHEEDCPRTEVLRSISERAAAKLMHQYVGGVPCTAMELIMGRLEEARKCVLSHGHPGEHVYKYAAERWPQTLRTVHQHDDVSY